MSTIPIATSPTQKLPTGTIQTQHVRQDVDLNPSGATVALTTAADNPFTREGAGVTVMTQQSGGMSPAPTSMQSQRLQHSFMPGMSGLGEEDAQESNAFSSILNTVTSAGSDTLSMLSDRERRKAEEAKAGAAGATAEARRIEAETEKVRAETEGYLARVAENKGSRALFAVAGIALAGALVVYMMQKKTGKKYYVTKPRKR